MFTPKNEMGVVFLFAQMCGSAGWEVVEIGAAFPDAILRKNGELWRAEFEYQASNFIYHQHDFRECDLIVCWENDRPDMPLPVIELRNDTWLSNTPDRCELINVEKYYWQIRAKRAELRLERKIREKEEAKIRKIRPLSGNERRETLRDILHTELDGKPIEELNKSALARRLSVTRPTINADLESLIASGELSLNGHIRVS